LTTPVNETPVESVPVAELGEPLLQGSTRIHVSREAARLIASSGRAAVIWLPVYAFLTRHVSSLEALLVLSAIVTAVWFLALRAAFAAARLTLLALGPTVAAGIGTGTGLAAVSALNPWLPGMQLGPQTLLAIAGSVFVLSATWEALVYRSLAGRNRVLIVGASDGGSELIEELALSEDAPFEIVGLVDDERASDLVAGVPLHGRIEDLAEIVEAQRPDLVVLAVADKRPDAFNHLLDVAATGFKVIGLPEFYEHAFGRVPVRHLTPAWFMGMLSFYHRTYSRLAKRTFDVAVGAIGLAVSAPLIPFIVLLVRRTPGLVIYRQTRLGEGGRAFTMYKFRTMRADAEEPGVAMWAEESDPRVTRSGRFLRKARLDELPQLWNVLKGDMSVVGPRPERPEFLELLHEAVPFWTRRHLVKPGITGWAQVRRGYTADAEGTGDKLSYDLWYLRHRSLVIDLAICVKTFATLLSGAGAR
jgi:exopolysaccharide biosynthesis polyprenyl glycosylphosphotransferase